MLSNIIDRSAVVVTQQIVARIEIHDSKLRDLVDYCVKVAMSAAYQNVMTRSNVTGGDIITIALSDIRSLVERDT